MICMLAAHGPQVARVERGHVGAVVDHAAAGRLDQPQDRPAGGGLAAAALADQAERLPAVDVEADAVDGSDMIDHAREDASADGKVDLQVLDFQQRPGFRSATVVESGG